MSTGSRSGQRLAVALRAGAVYDWLLAGVILVAPGPLFALLRFPPPADAFLFRLAALPLLFFGLLYWTAGRRADQPALVGLSLVFRGAGGLVLLALTLAHDPAGRPVYLAIALLDFAWAALWWGLARSGARQ